MKRGYLGLMESVYLAGRSAGHSKFLEERGISVPTESIPVDKMIYVAGFQGGIEQFLTPLKQTSEQPIDKFISKRVLKPKQQNPELFSKLLALKPVKIAQEEEFKVVMVLNFLHDLIVAMENNASVINISGIPSIEDVKRYYSPDIALPVCTLLSAFKTTEELLPAPARVVSSDDISRFKNLLVSDIYSRYASAHQEIDFSLKTTAISEIRKRGDELLAASKGVLLSRRVSVSLLAVVPKVVDAAFGKLPGTLAQTAGDLAARFLENKKNIVVYRFEDWVNEYTSASLVHAIRNQTNAKAKSNGPG